MGNRKQPEVRFEGFEGEWRISSLGDVTNYIKGYAFKSKDYSDKGIRIIRVSDLSDDNINEFNNKVYVANSLANKHKKYTIEKEEIIITTVGSKAEMKESAVGRPIIAKQNNNYLLNQNLVKIKTIGNSFSYFIYCQLISPKYVDYISSVERGNANQANIAIKDLWKFCFLSPEKDEQKKIGTFFKQLDDKIALCQRQLELLKEQKKGFLQKMFPKSGEKTPEVRFAGFTEEWEEKKLGEIANHRGGTAMEKYFDVTGQYKVISIGSYGIDSKYIDQNIRVASNKTTDSRLVRRGELTMVLNDKTANGTIIGRTLLVDEDNKYVINQRTEIISPKENLNSDFAYTILNGCFREKVKRIVQGGTQIYVNYPAIEKLTLFLPIKNEQQKIGTFFKQLDDVIALNQKELDVLKETKKGFLQKMFV